MIESCGDPTNSKSWQSGHKTCLKCVEGWPGKYWKMPEGNYDVVNGIANYVPGKEQQEGYIGDYRDNRDDPNSPDTLSKERSSSIIGMIIKGDTEGLTEQQKMEGVKKGMTCFICEDRPVDAVLVPCGCFGVCLPCADPKPGTCRKCGGQVTDFCKFILDKTVSKAN